MMVEQYEAAFCAGSACAFPLLWMIPLSDASDPRKIQGSAGAPVVERDQRHSLGTGRELG